MALFAYIGMSMADMVNETLDLAYVESIVRFKALIDVGVAIQRIDIDEIAQDYAGGEITNTLNIIATVNDKEYTFAVLLVDGTGLLNDFVRFNQYLSARNTVVEYLKSLW